MGSGISIGSIAGAGIGFLIGGFSGMGIFGFLGGLLFPPPPPDPPKLGDLGVNNYIRSTPVPIAYGQNKIYGGVIAICDNYVEMENEGNKKNPNYTPRYYAQFAIAICEGPIDSYVDFLINENSISEAQEEDKIDVDLTEYLGTPDQAINSVVSTFFASAANPGIPWRNTAYVFCDGSIGRANQLPTISVTANCLLTENPNTDKDANPVKALYDFLTNSRYGVGADPDDFDGSPTTTGSWAEESDYCDELVTRFDDVQEPRFRYSNVLMSRVKAFDIIQDILTTCRGFIFVDQGLLKIKIEKATEEPVFWFADQYIRTYVVNHLSIDRRIYANFAAMEEGYWVGDIGYLIDRDGNKFEIIVVDQTNTYIDIGNDVPHALTVGYEFVLEKQNITKGTFKYNRKATRDTFNRYRVECINRDNKYRWDVVEMDNVYDIDETNEVREQTTRLEGVKRRSQAYRMCSFFLDYQSNVKYVCSFDTDIVGYILSIGDIVGVSHSIPQWAGKLFRIVGKEELDDFNVKLTFIEYIPYVYHDYSEPLTSVEDYDIENPYIKPPHVNRFNLIEDPINPRIYYTFKKPDRGTGTTYWCGVMIYKKNGDSWEYEDRASIPTPSVELFNGIDTAVTSIKYDVDTMYGSFPASGSFFIGREEIAYSSINDLTDRFEGCTRGYNGTNAASHLATADCILRQSFTPYYEYSVEEIGSTLEFKVVSINTYEMLADPDTAPTDTIEITGYVHLPGPPSLIQLNSQGGDWTLVSGDAVFTWYMVTKGSNKGYGYIYGYASGYGDGVLEDIYETKIEVYDTATDMLLREVFLETTVETWTYTVAMNESDNTVYNPNLTFKFYEVDTDFLYSLSYTIITNS